MTDTTVLPQPRPQATMYLIGLGHAGTHWVLSTFFILLPYLTRDLGLSYTAAGLVVSGLHVAAFAGNVSSGVVSDLTGRRSLLLALSLSATAVALLLLGATHWYLVIVAMAALIGAANNLWHPPAVALLSRHYPERRGFALSIHATGASLGDMTGPLAAGALLLALSWQGTAMVSSLPALALAVLFWATFLGRDGAMEEAAPASHGRGAYVQGMRRLLRRRSVLGLCLLAGLRAMVQTGLTVFLPLYLADVLRVSPVLVGGTVMAMHLGGAIVSPLAGALSDRYGPRPVVMAGLSVTTVIIVGLTFIRWPVAYVAAVSLLGFVLYSVRPVLLAWLMNLSPPELRGSSTSLMFGAQSALAVAMPLVGGLVADAYSLVQVFYVIAGIMLLANGLLLLLPPDDSPAAASSPPL